MAAEAAERTAADEAWLREQEGYQKARIALDKMKSNQITKQWHALYADVMKHKEQMKLLAVEQAAKVGGATDHTRALFGSGFVLMLRDR